MGRSGCCTTSLCCVCDKQQTVYPRRLSLRSPGFGLMFRTASQHGRIRIRLLQAAVCKLLILRILELLARNVPSVARGVAVVAQGTGGAARTCARIGGTSLPQGRFFTSVGRSFQGLPFASPVGAPLERLENTSSFGFRGSPLGGPA